VRRCQHARRIKDEQGVGKISRAEDSHAQEQSAERKR
jgi:hypothetical protein